jgi:hypothetical protein
VDAERTHDSKALSVYNIQFDCVEAAPYFCELYPDDRSMDSFFDSASLYKKSRRKHYPKTDLKVCLDFSYSVCQVMIFINKKMICSVFVKRYVNSVNFLLKAP